MIYACEVHITIISNICQQPHKRKRNWCSYAALNVVKYYSLCFEQKMLHTHSAITAITNIQTLILMNVSTLNAQLSC